MLYLLRKRWLLNWLLKINRKYNFEEKSIRTACDLILFGLNNNEILVCIYGTLDIHSEEQCNFKNILAAIRAGKSYKHIFKDCVSRFDESKYVNINRDKINEIIKSTHDKKDTKRIILQMTL